MPTKERLIDMPSDWGHGKRGRTLSADQVALVLAGDHTTDAKYAAMWGLSPKTIRNIRLDPRRYRDVKKSQNFA